jgi:uncharacterized protein (TIGR03083 family)
MSRVPELTAALWASHRRLDNATRGMTREQLSGPSYCSEWTIAQVLSHLGSGVQAMGLRLDAGLAGTEQPSQSEIEAIWAVWDAMTPEDQAEKSLSTDTMFLQRVDTIPADQLEGIHISLFGTPADADRLLGVRLSEHAVHTWDIVVMGDPAATLGADAAMEMIDGLGLIVAYTGKPGHGPGETTVITTDPDRTFRLSAGDAVSIAPATSADPPATAVVRLPAEAWIRLVYGRLDAAHTPETVTSQGISIDTLRAMFPGV